MRQLTKNELRAGNYIRERSLRLEKETGANSIATIEHVYHRRDNNVIECPWPGCKFARKDPVAIWQHVHNIKAHPGVLAR